MQVIPQHPFSQRFTLRQGSEDVAELSLDWLREAGDLFVDGQRYRVSRESWRQGAYAIEGAEGPVATAKKPSAFTNTLEVSYGTDVYTLRRSSPFTRATDVTVHGQRIGRIAPEHPFTRRATVDLPEDLPRPVRAFMTWLVLVLWRRQSNSAGGGAGAGAGGR